MSELGLIGMPTKEALDTLKDKLKDEIKQFSLANKDKKPFWRDRVKSVYFDENGVLTAILYIPPQENITGLTYYFLLEDKDNSPLVEIPLDTPVEFIAGFGGEIPVKITLSGEPATIVFKDQPYIIETEAKEIFLLPLVQNTKHLLVLEQKLIEKGIIGG